MNRAKFLIIYLFIFNTFNLIQAEEVHKKKINFNLKNDLKDSFVYMFKGSYLQFLEPSSMVLFGAGALTLWPVFNADRKIRNRQKPPSNFTHKVGHELANIFNFPVVPVISYLLARYTNDLHLKKVCPRNLSSNIFSLI